MSSVVLLSLDENPGPRLFLSTLFAVNFSGLVIRIATVARSESLATSRIYTLVLATERISHLQNCTWTYVGCVGLNGLSTEITSCILYGYWHNNETGALIG